MAGTVISPTNAWNEAAPAGATTLASTIDEEIRKLRLDVRERVPPYLTLTAGAEAANKRTITVQALDINGTALGMYCAIRIWVSDSNYGYSSALGITGEISITVTVGTVLEEIDIDCQHVVISNSAGKVEYCVESEGARTLYILAELDGRIYSSGAVTWAA